MRRIMAVFLIMLVLLCAACTPGTYLDLPQVPDRYAVEPDIRAHFTLQDHVIYRRLIDGVVAYQEQIDLSDDYEQNLYYLSVLQKSPFASLVRGTRFTKDKTSVTITYEYKQAEHAERIRFTEEKLLQILREIILPDMNETEKTLAVYRYFACHLQYDHQWQAQEDHLSDIDLYEALSTGKGVCHAYSYLCWYALAQLGVDAFCITGVNTADGAGHMWLLVKMDGVFYHCDPTWESIAGGNGLGFFGMTDEGRRETGVRMADFAAFHEPEYGPVSCTDNAFEVLREVSSWRLEEGHRLRAFDGAGEFVFDTARKCPVEN